MFRQCLVIRIQIGEDDAGDGEFYYDGEQAETVLLQNRPRSEWAWPYELKSELAVLQLDCLLYERVASVA